MMVVMGIIGTLTALSYGAFLSASIQAQVDSKAEKLFNAIKEVQNNSIAIKKIGGGTAGWGVRIAAGNAADAASATRYSDTTYVYTIELSNPADPANSYGTTSIQSYPLTGEQAFIRYTAPTASTSANEYLDVAYMIPFGNVYIFGKGQSNSCGNIKGSSVCYWQESGLPSGEFELRGGSGTSSSPNFLGSRGLPQTASFQLEYKGKRSRNIYINGAGDVYMQ
jgi:type II secretory pathway pseudopilin PulG